MKTHSWVQISIQIDEPYQDLLVGLLVLLGCTGFVQEEKTLQCIIPQQQWNSAFKLKFEATLAHFKVEFPSLDLSTSWTLLHEENWNKKWEQQTGIVEATPTIIIKPSWKKLPKRHVKKIVLHIDPKMSFGTGHHETTRLCLHLIERFLTPHMKVLDFGTGTGVLGIACVKLGAQSVYAIDNDDWAIENAQENVKRNTVQKRMAVRIGSISSVPRHRFDLIVANIDFKTITRFIASLKSRVRKQGIIILSGILRSDLAELLKLFSMHGLVPIDRIHENEWTSIALRRIE
jgi:ribosomal protein L11 methyltransferase